MGCYCGWLGAAFKSFVIAVCCGLRWDEAKISYESAGSGGGSDVIDERC